LSTLQFIQYGTGSTPSSVYGEEYLDTVTINSDLVITNQSIGVAYSGSNIDLGGLDGILGLGPVDLTRGIVDNEVEVPTVTDNLYEQGAISSKVLGVFFSPASSNDATGELTFGGYDASKITGDVNYVPVTSTYPSNAYWGINQTISYGATSILSNTAGIIDTGTTLILIATGRYVAYNNESYSYYSDAFDKYQTATGGTLDSSTGLLKISSEQYNNLSSLCFQIGDVSYELTPNAQIWPRSLNTAIGGTADGIYLIVADIGSNAGSGLDFISGYCFLYAVPIFFARSC